MDEFHRNVDLNTSAMYFNYAATRAFAFWLDVACSLYITSVMFCFLIMDKSGKRERKREDIIIKGAKCF